MSQVLLDHNGQPISVATPPRPSPSTPETMNDETTAKLIAQIPVLQAEIKRWQERAGNFAGLANFAAVTALEDDLSENDIDQLNEIIDTVRPFLVFDEQSQ